LFWWQQPSNTGSPDRKSAARMARQESVAKEYITIAAFSDGVGDGISFQAGQGVKV